MHAVVLRNGEHTIQVPLVLQVQVLSAYACLVNCKVTSFDSCGGAFAPSYYSERVVLAWPVAGPVGSLPC